MNKFHGHALRWCQKYRELEDCQYRLEANIWLATYLGITRYGSYEGDSGCGEHDGKVKTTAGEEVIGDRGARIASS